MRYFLLFLLVFAACGAELESFQNQTTSVDQSTLSKPLPVELNPFTIETEDYIIELFPTSRRLSPAMVFQERLRIFNFNEKNLFIPLSLTGNLSLVVSLNDTSIVIPPLASTSLLLQYSGTEGWYHGNLNLGTIDEVIPISVHIFAQEQAFPLILTTDRASYSSGSKVTMTTEAPPGAHILLTLEHEGQTFWAVEGDTTGTRIDSFRLSSRWYPGTYVLKATVSTLTQSATVEQSFFLE